MKKVIQIAVLVSIIFSLWCFSPFLIGKFYPQLSDRGLIGDSFGAINSLYSGLALAGVVVAILLQSEELKLQRKELEDTRTELKRSGDAQTLSQQALTEQVRLTKIIAQLNSLNTLVEIQNNILAETSNQGRVVSRVEAVKKRDLYTKQIEQIIKNEIGDV